VPVVVSTAATLVDLMEYRATEHPGHPTFSFLVDGENEEVSLTNGELHRRALALAVALCESAPPESRVLLLFPSGLEFVSAFLGSICAGMLPVPTYPPDPRAPAAGVARLVAIVRDARPAIVLVDPALEVLRDVVREAAPDLASIPWIRPDALPVDSGRPWRHPGRRDGEVAFLQYTSGSTMAPRAVAVTHASLMHTQVALAERAGCTADSHVVSWLPLYHDMGLIGALLHPLYVGCRCTLLSPLAFLDAPGRWLRAISRRRGTATAAPNFAYELCVRKIGVAERAGLDLRAWQVATNGSETVRRDTMRRFVEAFAPYGLRPDVFLPAYGLAEATLFVAGRRYDAFAEPAGDDPIALAAAHDTRVVAVDPATQRPCAPGDEGELWVEGPTVAAGYWQRPAETRETFAARLADGTGPYLRTGDLGRTTPDGSVVITGRMKDLIVVCGRNHHPQDLEQAAERSHPALRPGCAAAFGVPVDGEEQVVLVHEIRADARAAEADVVRAIRRAVADVAGLFVREVVLVAAGTIPKTSSGKLRRHACREAYLEGAFAARPPDPAADTGAPSEVAERAVRQRAGLAALAIRAAPTR
jgi:acyl-CoA synthetase (AMP-forming)/AMP-acid ligase II